MMLHPELGHLMDSSDHPYGCVRSTPHRALLRATHNIIATHRSAGESPVR
jgi:hypothetical protein